MLGATARVVPSPGSEACHAAIRGRLPVELSEAPHARLSHASRGGSIACGGRPCQCRCRLPSGRLVDSIRVATPACTSTGTACCTLPRQLLRWRAVLGGNRSVLARCQRPLAAVEMPTAAADGSTLSTASLESLCINFGARLRSEEHRMLVAGSGRDTGGGTGTRAQTIHGRQTATPCHPCRTSRATGAGGRAGSMQQQQKPAHSNASHRQRGGGGGGPNPRTQWTGTHTHTHTHPCRATAACKRAPSWSSSPPRRSGYPASAALPCSMRQQTRAPPPSYCRVLGSS